MDDKQSVARDLYEQAKQMAGDDDRACLSLLQQAYALDPRRKYETKIIKLRQMLEESDQSSDSGDDIIVLSESPCPFLARNVLFVY